MILRKVIADIERKIKEGKFSKETEVEVLIVEKYNGFLIMAEIGKHSIKQLQGVLKK